MQINGVNNNPAYNPGTRNPQSASIARQIEKLEEKKREIEEDLKKRSTNPDPRAAQGDNAANSAVNQRILQQIEQQIQTLEQRQGNSRSEPFPANPSNNTRSETNRLFTGNHVDLLA